MKIEKKKLLDMKRCYCASSINMNGKQHLIFASEDPNVGCEMFSGLHFEKQESIWKEAGGCMSIVSIPGCDGQFLAIQEFYLKASPSLAKIVWARYSAQGFIIQDLVHLPYVHRFDIYHQNGVNYIIAATIATSKEHKEDWRIPGRIYVGELPTDLHNGVHLEVLVDGLYRNHGYWKDKDECCGYFGSDQGITKVTPPRHVGDAWRVEQIMEGNIGEIAMVDIDGDGEKEIMTIEPFHGCELYIYKKIHETYQKVYTYEPPIEFAHTLVGGIMRGVPTFLAGVRRLNAELFYVQYINGKFVTNVIEEGCGPANIALINQEDQDFIVAANHSKQEAAVYIIRD